MPRQLERALDSLNELPAEPPPLPWSDGRRETPEGQRVIDYVRSAASWYLLGIEIDPATRKRVATLVSSRADLRYILGALIDYYPCREFRRVFRRRALAGGGGDLQAWLAAFPDIEPEIRESTLARARRFKQPLVAIEACLVWARYLDGGDEAWRQIANTLVYDARREQRQRHPSGFVRHDLETHGTITPDEAARINELLMPTEVPPLESCGNSMWWQAPPPGWWRAEPNRFRLLARAALQSQAFAGERWREADELIYARALAGFTPAAWRHVQADAYRPDEPEDHDGLLARLVTRARALREQPG